MGLDELAEFAIERGDAGTAGDGFLGHLADQAGGGGLGRQVQRRVGQGGGISGFGQRLGVSRVPGAQEAGDGLGLGGADLGGGNVAGEQQQRPSLGEVERALKVGVDGVEQVAHAADAARLVDNQVGAAADQQAQLRHGLVLDGDRPEVGRAQAELVGDDAGVFGVALGLPADAALAGAVDGQAGHMDQTFAGGQQHGAEQGGDTAEQVDADQALALQRGEVGGELADVLGGVVDLSVEQDATVLCHRGGPMNLLGGVDAHADLHGALRLFAPPMQRPLPASNALNSDRSHRVISGRAKVAEWAALPPERWQTARMIAIPTPPPRAEPGMPGSARQHRNNGALRVRAE